MLLGVRNKRKTYFCVLIYYYQTRYKGTRLDGEKDFYETFFGGGTRGENVMISSGDGGNAATPLGLQAMQEVRRALIPDATSLSDRYLVASVETTSLRL